ncbi:spherulation-specific family 4 protein [Catellatospora sichuanensis]|uniref:spherulation-specific family 4 protein n=1 Tax=Catellatospora sichuanensis TaxID=1969805 RepID=UPI0016425301|nr:spherulation-specific family 4 protein [Catellatospora sichuanensis]
MTTLLPLYTHPLEDPAAWQAVASAGPTVTTIINVHNGPGRAADTVYDQATTLLRAAGAPMLGYVDLDYGHRADADIEDDLAAWHRYPIDGVFFDQVPTADAALAGTARMTRLARGLVVLNPGTRPDPAYAALADLVCTYEGPWPDYRQQPDTPDLPNAAHLVYGVPTAELAHARAVLATRTGGAGLVTDGTAPLPYRGVPSWLVPAGMPR